MKVQGYGLSFCCMLFALASMPLTVRAQTFTRTEVLTYNDNTQKWIIGQLKSRAVDGALVEETIYDVNTSKPIEHRFFGKSHDRISYNADGTVDTVTDGNGETTYYSSWKRGIPQSIRYADGSSVSADIDNNGWVLQATDENSYVTSYSHDSMGRLTRVSYPTGDSVAWQATTQAFVRVDAEEFGIPAGHWRQTVISGNGIKTSYYDAFWQPLLVQEYDATDVPGTSRFIRYAYDYEGRPLFSAYPSDRADSIAGAWSQYDALGRVTSVAQDSEHGWLISLFDYLPGFSMRVTDPLGRATTTTYQTFDVVDNSYPISMTGPEGAHTDISRDVFGKPLVIARHNGDGSISASRYYVYDVNHQLCKSIEPETAASAFGYDAAGNLAWTAQGLSLPSASTCDTVAAYGSDRRVDRTYDARNRLKSISFPDGGGSQSWSYAADGKPIQIATSNAVGQAQTINTYAYNKRRLLVAETSTQPGRQDWQIGYDYDTNGVLAGVRYPSGLYVDYAPNGLGQATRAANFVSNVSYYPNGSVKEFTYGNGITHSVQQNARQLPQRIVDSGVTDDAYTYDSAGNVTGIADGLDTSHSRAMVYDGLNRLTKAVSPSFGGSGEISYSYDVLDNLRGARLPGVMQYNYWYDAKNRLANVMDDSGATVIGLAYDAQGNLSNENGQGFRFDYGNRLREAVGKETYGYDGYGRRTVSWSQAGGNIFSMYGADGKLWRQDNYRNALSKEYVYLGNSLVAVASKSLASGIPTASVPSFSESGTYTVVWNSVAGSNGYELQEKVNGGEWSGAYAGSALTWVASGHPAGAYDYRVRACDGGACGGWSAEAHITVQLLPAMAPVLTAPSTSNSGAYGISWGIVSGASSYRLEESVNGASWGEIQASPSTSASFAGKTDGDYSYRVAACNAGGCGPISSTAVVQVRRPPAAVPALAVPATSVTGSYAVTWGSVASALSYRLEESVNGAAWSVVYNGTGLSFGASGRVDGTYTYRVIACNQGGCGSASSNATVTVSIPPPPPAVPTGLFAKYFVTNVNPPWNVRYTITWVAVSGADSYEVSSSRGSYKGSDTSVQITYVGPPGGAQFQVRACRGTICSAWSAAVIADQLPPTAATSITAPGMSTSGSYNVSWGSVASASSYRLEEGVNGASWTTVQAGASVSAGFANKADGNYGYRVTACNASGCGPVSAAIVVQVRKPPAAAPTLTVPASSNTGSYTVAWAGVANALTYQLEESANGAAWSTLYSGASLTFNVSAKANGTYTYRVAACNQGGCSSFSPGASVAVSIPPAAPAVPTGLVAKYFVTNMNPPWNVRYTVTWGAVSGADTYEVSSARGNYKGSNTSVQIIYLGPPAGAQFQVRACRGTTCSAWSAAVTATGQ